MRHAWMKWIWLFLPALMGYMNPAFPACEKACPDIADDESGFNRILENIQAIEWELAQITEWQADPITNLNALAAAVSRKQQNADNIREVLTDYFLYQRIQATAEKRGAEYQDYLQRLESLHELLNAAILAKDTLDLSTVENLKAKYEAFRNYYYKQPDFRLGQMIG